MLGNPRLTVAIPFFEWFQLNVACGQTIRLHRTRKANTVDLRVQQLLNKNQLRKKGNDSAT